MYEFEVTMSTGDGMTTEFEVKADLHKVEIHDGGPSFIVFYRRHAAAAAPELTPENVGEVAGDRPVTVGESGQIVLGAAGAPGDWTEGLLEVFRAPLLALLAVALIDDEEEGEE